MAKQRRDAVNEVLGSGSISPVLGKIATQQKAAETARVRDETPAVTTPPKAKAPRQDRARSATAKKPKAAAAKGANGVKDKRVPMSGEELQIAEGTMKALEARTGAKMEFTVVTRAMWSLLAENEDCFERVPAPGLRQPARADAVANAEFENRVSEFLLKVFQKAGG